jgi:hypothetical protein
MSKIAVFEYGKMPLAEWIDNNRDCEKMVLVGNVFYESNDKHSRDLLFDFNDIAKNFQVVEFDITDLHLVDNEGNIDEDYSSPYDVEEKRSSMIFKMLVNRKYGTKFIYNNGILTTLDGKVLIYHPETKHVIVPEGIEIIGNWAFISFDKMNKIDLPNSLKEIGDYSFKFVDNLKELTIPDSVEKLGEGSFCYSEIDSIKVSDKIETFPAYCFRYCKIDKLPSALKTIEDENCFYLENGNEVIELPYGFEHLGSYSIGYDFEEVRFPATTKYIAEDFWYDPLVGPDERDDKPKIIIDSDNPYFSVDENNNLIYKCVADIETTRLFSRRAISFVESETERNYLLEKDVLLSPKDMINLVEMSPEKSEYLRKWFYWDLDQTTILTEQERLMLSYIREKTNSVRDELHSFFKNRRLVAFGISSDGQETVLGKYSHSLSCTDDIEKMQDLEKYDKIIAKQYKVSDKNLKNELGRFEIDKDNYCINNIYYFEDYPIPQNIQNLIDAYIDLPHPFEAGDIVKTKHCNERFVVAEVIMPTKEQIESKYVDSSDMAVTVLPIEYSERVRECLRNGDKIPEELFNEHQHLCFLSLEMVEKFCS